MPRRIAVPLLAAVIAGSGVTAAAGSTGGPDGVASAAATRSEPARTVTLITGDRVQLFAARGGAKYRTRVLPGPGRGDLQFRTQTVGDKLYVLPSDVVGLVSAGRLDRRLFEVNGLVEAGYDDSRTTAIPLIVKHSAAASVRGRAGVSSARALPAVRGAEAVRVDKSRAGVFLTGLAGTKPRARLSSGLRRYAGTVATVWLDGKRHTTLDRTVPQIGAPAAWAAGYTGAGVKVAVLDGGIDSEHPDLADRVTAAKNFAGGSAGDGAGHGTHVASTIAGTAAASNGQYKGVASGASLLDGKVCDDFGDCYESSILAGMQWAAAEQQADVINMSLGGPDTPGVDPVEEALNTLTAQTGALFVVAAGNEGPGPRTVGSPGSAAAALTVGAVDTADGLAEFSSRGPAAGDGGLKPDVTAPGVGVVAAKAKNAFIGQPVGEHYLRLSGTSMATPHVAGAAALLLQQHPDWTPAELKAALVGSAKAHAGLGVFEQGAGRIDVGQAIRQTVLTKPASLSFGTASWPHDDDTPMSRQLTYRNLGDSDLTLNLAATVTGPDGAPAPDGAFTLSANTVTVPAGGTATVTATSNTNHSGPNGAYGGRVTATTGAGEVLVATPIGIDREEERYELTIAHLDEAGGPIGTAFSMLSGLDSDYNEFLGDEDGEVTVRLPKGRYHLIGMMDIERDDGTLAMHQVVQPVVTLDRDTRIEVDARITKPLQVTVPRADARVAAFELVHSVHVGRGASLRAQGRLLDRVFTASLGEPVPDDQFSAYLGTDLGRPDGAGGFRNSPYSYGLVNTRQGSYFDGLSRTVSQSELATVTSTVPASAAGQKMVWMNHALLPDPDASETIGASFELELPATMTRYLEAGPIKWQGELSEQVTDEWGFPENLVTLLGAWQEYPAGTGCADRWNGVVFGPSATAGWATRGRSGLTVAVPLHSDAAGHAGFSKTDSAAGRLYRAGELVAESDEAGWLTASDLPAEEAAFRVEMSATRPSVSGLSTRVDAEWKFRSAAPERSAQLPLWAVRYRPPVDAGNVATRLPVMLLPVELEPVPDSPVGKPRSVRIQVSGDDGAKWADATVRPAGGNRYLAVFPGPSGSHVSLKATMADSAGNTTTQTIIRGYQLR